MSNQRRFSDQVLPSVFSRLDTVFPEFGWVCRGRGWVATNESFAHTRFGVRADRIICTDQRGYYIYGSGHHEHWLSYVNGGVFPSGDHWHRVAGELAGRVSMKGFTSSREVSGWARLMAAAREQLASPGGADIRRYCENRELP